MKLTVERNALAAALSKVTGIIERKNTLPILGNVYLSAKDSTLTIRATDLDIEVCTRIECDVTDEGECTVQAELLGGIVKKYKSGPIVYISHDDSTAVISQGSSKFKLATLDTKDFPVIASDEYTSTLNVDAVDLSRLLNKTSFAMSTEETKYYLNGVYLHHTSDGITAVSTDGHKLAKAWVAGDDEFPPVIIPRKTVGELRKIVSDGKVVVSISESKIRFETQDTVIVSKVIDAKFPDYERVIPTSHSDMFKVDAVSFSGAAGMVAMVSEDKMSRGVTLDIGKDEVRLYVMGSQNEAEDTVIAVVNGGVCRVGFSSKYLAEALSQAEGGDVEFYYDASDAMRPALINATEDDRFLAVVMPLRA